jgi:hypothetical protein
MIFFKIWASFEFEFFLADSAEWTTGQSSSLRIPFVALLTLLQGGKQGDILDIIIQKQSSMSESSDDEESWSKKCTKFELVYKEELAIHKKLRQCQV